ncbi:hypothetical protein [Microbacterium elymi]|uniref:Uncharacterized protein n=1 Tax=Microbacterium elymi TaxID=2909587 RepID=A0ABY5NHW1_9MICO|nr:hypothetical protein [Microbacterium elymi]UUT34755.1 hypothetical protein L2X98_30340 [Microbacterium elymi]
MSRKRVLIGVHQHPKAEFWPDAVSYADGNLSEVRGHRQVTDAYLLSLARRHPRWHARDDG